jgi:hypothetical protein
VNGYKTKTPGLAGGLAIKWQHSKIIVLRQNFFFQRQANGKSVLWGGVVYQQFCRLDKRSAIRHSSPRCAASQIKAIKEQRREAVMNECRITPSAHPTYQTTGFLHFGLHPFVLSELSFVAGVVYDLSLDAFFNPCR